VTLLEPAGLFLDFRVSRANWGEPEGIGWNRELGFGLTFRILRRSDRDVPVALWDGLELLKPPYGPAQAENRMVRAGSCVQTG
jgi:hypothetical protein